MAALVKSLCLNQFKLLLNFCCFSDEYTRITTPRQDVLFKKGYLNKPKTYQTQTSTGTSTNSTGNSTGNGTPDHQSAGKNTIQNKTAY